MYIISFSFPLTSSLMFPFSYSSLFPFHSLSLGLLFGSERVIRFGGTAADHARSVTLSPLRIRCRRRARLRATSTVAAGGSALFGFGPVSCPRHRLQSDRVPTRVVGVEPVGRALQAGVDVGAAPVTVARQSQGWRGRTEGWTAVPTAHEASRQS